MKKIVSISAIFVYCLLFHTHAVAEIYQWTDKDGTVHFSDNLASVPKGKSAIKRQEDQGYAPAVSDRVVDVNSGKTRKELSGTNIRDNKNNNFSKNPTINFNPGNYEVTNWMELPWRGRSKQEKDVHCLGNSDIGWKMYRESGCELLSEWTSGDTLNWEFKCKYNGMTGASGSITYHGDSFDGTLIYHNDKGNLKIGLSGKRVGDCNESKW